MGRLKLVLKEPSHCRRFSKLLWGMISLDYIEYNFKETECLKSNPNLEFRA